MNKREVKRNPVRNEIIYCPGLTAPMLVLTKEEEEMEVTTQRINEYHYSVGEDFLEYSAESIMNKYTFGGYLIAKFPERSLEIIEVMNYDYFKVCNFAELFDFDEKLNIPEYYKYVCDFVNLTVKTKARFNEILLSVKHYYDRD